MSGIPSGPAADGTSIRAASVTKSFNRRSIFENVGFDVRPGEVFGITGNNGSGKSTLLKIVAGVLAPNRGSVEFSLDGSILPQETRFASVGFLAPYLQLFEEFSAAENIRFFASIRGLRLARKEAAELLAGVGLPADRRDPVRGFSSGMKQRMKLIFATMHAPRFLLLDEPTTNLDAAGIATVYAAVEAQRSRGCVLIATNDESDIARCDRVYDLNRGAVVDRRTGEGA